MSSRNRERASVLTDLESEDDELRRLAVERLGVLGDGERLRQLIRCLGDPSWRVRKAAVQRLVSLSPVEDVGRALIEALRDDENPGRRNAAVEALVGCGSAVLPELCAELSCPDADVRKLVVDSIAGIGDPKVSAEMVRVLDDPDANVRAAAADALGVLGGEAALAALRSVAVSSQQDKLIRLSALRALARQDSAMTAVELAEALDDSLLRPAAFALLGHQADEQATQALLKGLACAGRSSREAAIEGLLSVLSKRDGDDARELVEAISSAARSSDVLIEDAILRLEEGQLATRLVMVQFLGIVGGRTVVEPLLAAALDEAVTEVAHNMLAALSDESEAAIDSAWECMSAEVRLSACALLARTSGRVGRARLTQALSDPSENLRIQAARSLAQRSHPDSLGVVVERLLLTAAADREDNEEELSVLVEAVSILSRAGASDAGVARDQLAARLPEAREAEREVIVVALGSMGQEADRALVSRCLQDESPRVRRAAVDAVANLDRGGASESLRLALTDEDTSVRIAAARALSMSEDHSVLQDLLQLIQDDDLRVRACALRAVGTLCSRSSNPSLRRRAIETEGQALDREGPVAMAALEALRELGGADAARVALQAIERDEPEIVQAAVACVGQHGDADALRELLPLVAHPAWNVRVEAIQLLAERREARAVPPILRRLETERDDFVRDAILLALRRLEG